MNSRILEHLCRVCSVWCACACVCVCELHGRACHAERTSQLVCVCVFVCVFVWEQQKSVARILWEEAADPR
jgi:hypothetical protein